MSHRATVHPSKLTESQRALLLSALRGPVDGTFETIDDRHALMARGLLRRSTFSTRWCITEAGRRAIGRMR